LPGAPVSTPLAWSELKSNLDPGKYDVKSVVRRLARTKKDPMASVLEESPDLVTVFERLLARLSG